MDRWIFGYGSLVWRPAFEHLERRPARLRGFARRFWQGSADHRGGPGAPGRVVTLIAEEAAETVGMAYRVDPGVYDAVMARLDHREQGGYERHRVALEALDDASRIDAVIYVAGPDNPHWLGPAPPDAIARTIAARRGPSGPNDEYLLRLEAWLRGLGVEDRHVFELADALRALRARQS